MMASLFTVVGTFTICAQKKTLECVDGYSRYDNQTQSHIFGSFQISRAGIYPKYSKETIMVLFLLHLKEHPTMETLSFTCMYNFEFGGNATGLNLSYFGNF